MTDTNNTPEVYPTDVWIVVGNASGWGRGDTLKDALGNMLKETGPNHTATEAIVYRWAEVPSDRVEDFYVDGYGTTRSPVLDPAIEPKRLHVKDAAALKKLKEAYYAFGDAVEEFEYSGDMDSTFG